jgi:hypothetical protein
MLRSGNKKRGRAACKPLRAPPTRPLRGGGTVAAMASAGSTERC